MSPRLSRRTILSGGAALAATPILPAPALAAEEPPCSIRMRDDNWLVTGSVGEVELSGGNFGQRSEHMAIYGTTPKMYAKHSTGPTLYSNPETYLDPKSIRFGFLKSEWAAVKDLTQPEIDAARPGVEVAEVSGQGAKIYRWVIILMQGPNDAEALRVDYRFQHRFDRWNVKEKDGTISVRERESHRLEPHAEVGVNVKALKMITSGDPIRMATYVHDDAAVAWIPLNDVMVPTERLAPLYQKVQTGLTTVRQTEPAQTCVAKGCFLTTACCSVMGRADDCAELRSLRAFRDGWLNAHPDGPALIAEYYRIAPALCRAIEGDHATLRRLYWGTILPCVLAIHLGANSVALRLYRRMINRLGETYPDALG